VIVLAVRWYLRFGLSNRAVEQLLDERGIEVDHVTAQPRRDRRHALVHNIRRGHYELASGEPQSLRLASAFSELATAI
jgi:transposase-like protein